MKEHPILFNGEMVRAILGGRKTQTRRVMKVQPSANFSPMNMALELDYSARWYTPGVVDKDGYLQPVKKQVFGVADEDEGYTCPFGALGDRLWVRETFGSCGVRTVYRADINDGAACQVRKWIPSLHMPRETCRLVLVITNVRVERLNDISQEDAQAEGMELTGWRPTYSDPDSGGEVETPYDNFAELWQSIYGAESWDANPWVWVVEFKLMENKQ